MVGYGLVGGREVHGRGSLGKGHAVQLRGRSGGGCGAKGIVDLRAKVDHSVPGVSDASKSYMLFEVRGY